MEVGEYHQESKTSLFRNLEDFFEMLSASRLCGGTKQSILQTVKEIANALCYFRNDTIFHISTLRRDSSARLE